MRFKTPLTILLPLVSLVCTSRLFGYDNFALNNTVHLRRAVTNNASAAREIIDTEAFRFGNSEFAMFDHHDDTLYKLHELYQSGKLAKDPKRTLIHFDYHSDLYRNNSHTENNINIGNYINTMVWKQDVGEVWWILPDETRSTAPLSTAWGCASIQSQNELYWGRPNIFRDWQFRDGSGDQLICVDTNGHFSFAPATSTCAAGTRTVRFIKRTLGDLLAADNIAVKGSTILDVDADFFDMSGQYANESPGKPGDNIGSQPHCYSLHYSEQRLNDEFKRFSIAITQKLDLRPDLIAVARSPGYTVENTEKIFNFLSYLGSKTKNGNSSEKCTVNTAGARIIADTEISVRLPSGGFSTAKPFEPVCVKKKTNNEILVHFPLPPAGDAYVEARYVKLCYTEKLRACIADGGDETTCTLKECTKVP